ncbi:MAG: CapA family protein [Clostridia bacterium]|nr:CapA family protein [Clostridia bacterium]
MHRRITLSCLSILLALLCLVSCAPADNIPLRADPLSSIETMPHETSSEQLTAIEPLPDEIVRVSFAAIGDNLVHPCIYIDARNRAVAGGRAYNFKPPYADIQPIIAAADFAFINQETPMAGEQFGYSGYPRFNSPQDLGRDLVELGFDIIGMANNHMLDKGEAGYAGTVNFIKTLNATFIGAYENVDDYNNIRIVEKDGFTIALLAYTQHTNYINLPAGSSLYVPYLRTEREGFSKEIVQKDDEELARQIKAAKELADAVIVSVHWGTENVHTPDADQVRRAQLMADLGVNVILGHHSHTLQPIVELTGKDGNKTLCIYSLGNIISAMEYAKNMLGGIFQFELVSTNGVITFENVSLTPTMYYFGPSYYNGHIYLFENYTAELHSTHGTWRTYGKYSTMNDLYAILHNTIDNRYLPENLRK